MQPYWHNEQHGLTIYLGDCLDVLSALPAGIAQCCVTSPPYWGLRSYLPDSVRLKNDAPGWVHDELKRRGIKPI